MLRRSSIRREDAVVDTTPVTGNLVKVKDPKFITLVGKPANQTGFKVLRSDQGETTMAPPLLRRTRRSETNPVLKLTFPAGVDEESVKQTLDTYGMSGYTIAKEGEVYTAVRADLKSISADTTQQIKLTEDGLMATIARSSDSAPANPEEKTALTLAYLSFDAEKFTQEDVKRWTQEHGVDGEIQEPQNAGKSYVVRRSEVADGEDVRHMQLEDGITATIVRSSDPNVPDGFVAVINETAYGSWGWGQLDFGAMMADYEFSKAMDDALWKLRGLLDNIILWSGLPLDVRKELLNRALSQFGQFTGSLMDNLPRQLLVSVVRSANPQQEKSIMTQQASSGAATTDNQAGEKAVLTREDVAKMIEDAIKSSKEATPAAALAPAARSDATKTEGAAEPAATPATLSRADLEDVMSKALQPFGERLAKIEGATLVQRGDTPDPKPENVKRDVFAGAFNLSKKSK